MSVIGSNLLAGASGQGGVYEIERSLRFNDDDSAYLNRTPSSAGNRKTWTWSCWVKRANLGSSQEIFNAASGSSSQRSECRFNTSDELQIGFNPSGGTWFYLYTDAKYRDVSAWYHIVLSFDTTQATDADRTKLYVNGVLQAFRSSSYLAQNADGPVNNNIAHSIGRYQAAGSAYFDGYIAEAIFIDGSALDPTDFGETDEITGAWIPKKYAGSYGTNGFYLNFSDNSTVSALGTDGSGNGNNFTPNNFSVTAGAGNDSLEDTPTNNWCTLNPLIVTSSTLSNGNLTAVTPTGTSPCYGTFNLPTSGKWYWEYVPTANGQLSFAGIGKPLTQSIYIAYYGSSGEKWIDGSGSSYGATYGNNDVIGVAVNVDSNEITFYKNNVSQGAITGYALDEGDYSSFFGDGSGAAGTTYDVNFGQRAFAYTPPTGFKALNTANLPEPTTKDGTEYFNTVLYTGNGSTQAITGVGFQPDLVWIKNRVAADSHKLTDAVRGATKELESDNTSIEATNADGLTAFNSDGFDLGADAEYNTNTETYVAWNWLAGGNSSSNTDGTITSTVSANPSDGFSIVTYTGTGSAATIGHGLGVAPKMVIAKNRDVLSNWDVYHADLTSASYRVQLNSAGAQSISNGSWNGTAPTSTVFSVLDDTATNSLNDGHIAYCFTEVEGYSKFGSYTGNGSADGPFVYCGFRPSWLLVKRSSSSEDWAIYDNKRSPINTMDLELFPNDNVSEYDGNRYVDFVSNGFKLRANSGTSNTSGVTYIFVAFAKHPFKYANAR